MTQLLVMFPLIPLLRIEATKEIFKVEHCFDEFPLIPLLRIEATEFHKFVAVANLSVSINSTSKNRSNFNYNLIPEETGVTVFPLIPLLRIEATVKSYFTT